MSGILQAGPSRLDALVEADRENLDRCMFLRRLLDHPALQNHHNRGLWTAELRFLMGLVPVIADLLWALTKPPQRIE